MARVTLTEDGTLGKAGEQVWVNDGEVEQTVKPIPAKKTAAPHKSTSKGQ